MTDAGWIVTYVGIVLLAGLCFGIALVIPLAGALP